MHSSNKPIRINFLTILPETKFQNLNNMKRALFVGIFCAASIAVPVAGNTEEIEPVDQFRLLEMLVEKGPLETFLNAFELGDELTEFQFTVSHGVGANVKQGQRFSRIPRAELDAAGEWASHFPTREGGPNATSCIACHNAPIDNGAGDLATNVLIDPSHSGDPSKFLERNTLHLMGLGAVQRIAEEMSEDLLATKKRTGIRACSSMKNIQSDLVTKSVNFGFVAAKPVIKNDGTCVPEFDMNGISGVDEDLIIKAFGWKGTAATIRKFNRDAAHNEIGMQAIELVGALDGDFDGTINELSVGDITALTLYIAGLQKPTSKIDLASAGVIDLSEDENFAIRSGDVLFNEIGCAVCHKPSLEIYDAEFSEPSKFEPFREAYFPSGDKPETHGVDPEFAITFDLTKDQPNNQSPNSSQGSLGSFAKSGDQGAEIFWYSDFKRHDMGPLLSDPDDPYGIGASVWPTRSLAGVGSTGPWLHNGHATTLHDAILAHGGEASQAKSDYSSLPSEKQIQIITFLENLVLFKEEEPESNLE